MEFYLQMGHGMQGLSQELISLWGKGTVILSPVNISQGKIVKFSQQIKKCGGDVLFDPQLFFPYEGHNKLKEYDYWPEDGVSISSENINLNMSTNILNINKKIGSSAIIIPSAEINERNLKYLHLMESSANFFKSKTDKPILATLCLSADIIRNSDLIENIIEELRKLQVDGFYIVPHPYNNEYIVSDPMWMIGMLKIISCLKLFGKKVIVGYSNHQGLIYSIANVDAIASGTYMNTRCFMPSKFKVKEDGSIKQRSVWYYLPDAFCEYKSSLLDVAMQRGYLDKFKPRGSFQNEYSEMLFNGAQPSSTNYNETNSFKHYLYCLKKQCDMLTLDGYTETVDKYEFMLNNAENIIRDIKKFGMSGQNRSFEPGIEANKIAMVANHDDYGFKLRFDWH